MITIHNEPCSVVSGPARANDVYTRHYTDPDDADAARDILTADAACYDDNIVYTVTTSPGPCVTVTCDTCGRSSADPADGDTIHYADVGEARRVSLADGWVPGHLRDLTIRCPECVPAGPWVVRQVLPKWTRCRYGCPEPYHNYPVTVLRLDRLTPLATGGSIAMCVACATPVLGVDPSLIRAWARRVRQEREIWVESRAQWFRAERNRTVGPFATYNMIQIWRASSEFLEASARWYRENPEPRYPRS
jgi:hypothetical protein